MAGLPIAALMPVVVLAVGFVVYCLADVVRQPRTRGLPKPVWAVLVLISIPLGGIAYLLLGRPLGADHVVSQERRDDLDGSFGD